MAKMLANAHNRPGCCNNCDRFYAPGMHRIRRQIQRRREERFWRKDQGE